LLKFAGNSTGTSTSSTAWWYYCLNSVAKFCKKKELGQSHKTPEAGCNKKMHILAPAACCCRLLLLLAAAAAVVASASAASAAAACRWKLFVLVAAI
jgi:hypothetical protein